MAILDKRKRLISFAGKNVRDVRPLPLHGYTNFLKLYKEGQFLPLVDLPG